MEIIGINHVCLVVKSQSLAEDFYVGIIGLERHHSKDSWFHLTKECTLHLVEIPEAESDKSLYHEVQHFALQTPNLQGALSILLKAGQKPFQMDFQGQVKGVDREQDALDFGIGTLFVYDPDGNLVEFIEQGRGVFAAE